MNCPNCGALNRDTATFCARCAAPLSSPTDPMAGGPSAGRDVARRPQISAATDVTQPLPNLPQGFAPLPPGALLNDDRYEVVDTLTSGPQINTYHVRDNQPVRRCPNPGCGAWVRDAQETHCLSCGADLGSAHPVNLTRWLREAADLAQFDAERQLVERGLDHPGLLLPQDHFFEAPYADSRRAYQCFDLAPALAAALTVPQELTRAFQWGVHLAQAMTFLHEHQIALRQIDAEHIAIDQDGQTARWTFLTGAEIVTSADHTAAAALFARDVWLLAQTLFYLATGLKEYSPDAPLPDPVKELFARALLSQPRPFSSAHEFAVALEELWWRLRRPPTLTLTVGRRSDVGRERQLNEDGLLTLLMDQVLESVNWPLGLFVVADGMGGHSAGEVATRLTLNTVRHKAVTELMPALDTPIAYDQWLVNANAAANTVVYEQRRQAGTDMGNTLVMALVAWDMAYIANVGDSRAYLVNEREIRQLTTDHSLVERLVATGKITPEQARTHPQRNVIYRTIGDRSHVEVDVLTHQLNVGDFLLLCSDGLTGMVTDEDVHSIVRSSLSPQEACDRLVRVANDAGGEDNITVVLVQLSA